MRKSNCNRLLFPLLLLDHVPYIKSGMCKKPTLKLVNKVYFCFEILIVMNNMIDKWELLEYLFDVHSTMCDHMFCR